VPGHIFDPRHAHRLDEPERLRLLPPDVIVELLHLTGSETVVDYGAGTGAFTLPVARALPHGRVVAVDLSQELLAKLREKLDPELAEHIELVHTVTNEIPLADAAADVVLGVNVLHEIADQAKALAEIRRVLKPGGRFVCVDWTANDRPVGPPRAHMLTLPDARSLLEAVGLEVKEMREPGGRLPYHYVVVGAAPH